MIKSSKGTQLELFAISGKQDQKLEEFIEYVLDFYSPESELYPEMQFTREEVVAQQLDRSNRTAYSESVKKALTATLVTTADANKGDFL